MTRELGDGNISVRKFNNKCYLVHSSLASAESGSESIVYTSAIFVEESPMNTAIKVI
jgi:hypothetical protein